MKKIAFSEKYGMNQAVVDGRKTMVRDIVPQSVYNQTDWKSVEEGNYVAVVDGDGYYHDIRRCGKYQIGEVVAVAMKYKTIYGMLEEIESTSSANDWWLDAYDKVGNGFGWDTMADTLERDTFFTAKAAFAALADKIGGKGTWASNPWVFAYEFKLIK